MFVAHSLLPSISPFLHSLTIFVGKNLSENIDKLVITTIRRTIIEETYKRLNPNKNCDTNRLENNSDEEQSEQNSTDN